MVGAEAKLGLRLQGVAPNLMGCLLKAVNFLLPREGGAGGPTSVTASRSRSWSATCSRRATT